MRRVGPVMSFGAALCFALLLGVGGVGSDAAMQRQSDEGAPAASQPPQSEPSSLQPPASSLPPRFTAVAVYIDSGGEPLAAYQFEFSAEGDAKIVGIENGEHPAFDHAPYYDPAAMTSDRAIVAAFNTGQDLPAGRTRVSRLHLQVRGEPEFRIQLAAAAGPDGRPIDATIHLVQE